MGPDFVTLDFETTGLRASTNRVIEVGIVRTTSSGKLVEQFSTLINPGRDVGRTDIHGISPGLLNAAPRFDEISGDIAEMLNGAVLVAHNAHFDLRFLRAELAREGRRHSELDALCTLELMYAGYPKGPRKLIHCCDFFGIDRRDAHCALDDAQMASELLHRLLDEFSPTYLPEITEIDLNPKSVHKPLPRENAVNPRERESNYLAELLTKMPEESGVGITSAVIAAEYLNLLDVVLEDRKIDFDEAAEIVEFAMEVGLSADRLAALNSAYVANLCAVATLDGVVTDLEKKDLKSVALLLGVTDWEPLLEIEGFTSAFRGTPEIPKGCSVCFTGSMHMKRSDIEALAVSHGLVVRTGVTKTLEILVVADADSESTKAKKAHDYGIRVVHESVFIQMLNSGSN